MIGIGYDVHRLVKGRKLILGGVVIPSGVGELAHSDGDVLVHAIIDAILGAMGEGDIGKHFPDTDPKHKDISSLKLLARVAEIIKKHKFKAVNIDSTVVLQAPKIAPYVETMIMNIADTLGISAKQVNVKGKTEEGLGLTGKGKGIAAYAVCQLEK